MPPILFSEKQSTSITYDLSLANCFFLNLPDILDKT